ncbi:MAG: PAS domain-containing protein [Thalassobaculum sp.]|uniref:PAS domain-containing protein n=1 Tax=Thalassobaculum sp. TaxID=2022740 RepID=UPI0032EF0201
MAGSGTLERQGRNDRPSFRGRIADGRLQALYDFWLDRRGDRPALLRDDLDPTLIPRLLRNLVLADVDDGGRSIRYRLVGTEVVAAHGIDYTGLTVEELTSGDTLAYTRQLYGIVVGQAVPIYSEGRFRWEKREYRLTRRLHLPLSKTGEAVDMVLLGQVFDVEHAGVEERLQPARPDELAADLAALRAGGG